MKRLYIIPKTLMCLTFLSSTLFASVDEMMITPPSETTEKEDVNLEEEISPAPPPALIDLDDRKEKVQPAKYGNLALFVFNVVMFTTGMIVVKTIQGRSA